MAGVAFVTGKRYAQGKERSFFAMGTSQDDGFIYFNDSEMFRCLKDKTLVQIMNLKKNNWVATGNVYDLNVIDFDAGGVLDSIADLINGGGSVAPNADVEKMVKWCINIANDPSHGYDQAHRTGPDYDCSSLICTGARQGGFDVPITSTHYMVNAFTNAGWTWHPGWGNTSSNLKRGDILLNQGAHTELYIGNNQNVGAHSNEFGGITGGQPGDQTGNEISVSGYYAFPWDGILRYEK